jgi:hypothetical protein
MVDLLPGGGCHVRRNFWPDEDARLRALVQRLGTSDWRLIASHMPGRNVRQCRERWSHYLSASRPMSEWSAEEDGLLLAKHREIGPRWTLIARSFPGRSDVQLKRRWQQKVAEADDAPRPTPITSDRTPRVLDPPSQDRIPPIYPQFPPRPQAPGQCQVIHVVHWVVPAPP